MLDVEVRIGLCEEGATQPGEGSNQHSDTLATSKVRKHKIYSLFPKFVAANCQVLINNSQYLAGMVLCPQLGLNRKNVLVSGRPVHDRSLIIYSSMCCLDHRAERISSQCLGLSRRTLLLCGSNCGTLASVRATNHRTMDHVSASCA